ncbi:processed acidic surface protein [Peribacillus kribbensis]|uniref:processed acidic surface protein n=1 Tax=Peribacillus kribbensis TaxID=356658 RepID=UPI000421A2FF|nr:processed acidic surface protein [Peribacillus kribbensis]
MKKTAALLISISIILSFIPQMAMAASKLDLTAYLKELSKERGFEVTRSDIEELFDKDELPLESSFESVDELKEYLGVVISKDYSNLNSIYKDYDIDRGTLDSILAENKETLDDYIFLDDLDFTVGTYMEEHVKQEPDFDNKLKVYLDKISSERGMTVTKEMLEDYLSLYDDSVAYYATVDELSKYMGDVIRADYSNLDYFHKNYQLDRKGLEDLLQKNNKKLEDYIFMDQLEEDVWDFSGGSLPGMEDEIADELLPIFEQQLGLTKEELKRIQDHLASLEEKLSSDETTKRLDAIAEQMMEFQDFDTVTELTPAQIAKLLGIYDQLLDIFEMKASYSLVSNGKETPISLAGLLKIDDIKGAKLKINLYNLKGELLADMLISGDMVDSGALGETGQQVQQSVKEVKHTISDPVPVQKHIKPKHERVHKTVSGAKLPKTGGGYLQNALAGLAAVFAGLFIFRKVRKA